MRLSVILLSALLAEAALAKDLVVDAAGGGAYPTIAAAMADAQPDDRLLVMPGLYPAYQHSVAVDVVGVGPDPSYVTIDRIDYHVSVPVADYDTLVSNVTVGSAQSSDAIAISGNELPPGTLHLDAVVVDGAVFLGGGASGFYLLVTNCRIENAPGEGFLGAAVDVGGVNNFVEIRNSRIVGAAAVAPFPASDALRVARGTTLRLVNAEIEGGAGSGPAGPRDGGDAVVRGLLPGSITMRLDGGSVLAGGDAGVGGVGGDGVDVTGAIALGLATVTGGAGAPAGLPYADALPVPMATDLHLAVDPVLEDAANGVAFGNGDALTLSMTTPPAQTAIALGLDLDLPPPSLFLSIDLGLALWVPGNVLHLAVPHSPPLVGVGFELYAQGFTLEAGSGAVLISDTASIRLDLSP